MKNMKLLIEEVNRFPKGEQPNLLLLWKPWEQADYQVKYTDIYMGIEKPDLQRGEPLVSLWINVASIPCSEFAEAGLTAEDEAGPLPLLIKEEQELGFPIRRWIVSRDTVGTVALTYRFYPRVVPPDYKFRPYYDFRNEKNGVTAGGVASLVTPQKQDYHVHVRWDFSQMPSDTRAVSIKGEGDYDFIGTPEDYQFTMYAFGKISSHLAYDGQVKLYWLSEPLPDKERILATLPRIYKGLAEFFEDGDAPYSIFFRKDPFKMSNGATAFENGFIYGYSDEKPLDLDMAFDIFAHEVIHTWPHIEDQAGEGTWYHEGTAELYNIKIPYRCGITNLDFAAKQITLRGINYYSNKFIKTPNKDAWPLYWSEREAQWLPYGRGFFYLVDVDYKIRKASDGSRNLDNLVLEIEHMRRDGKRVTCKEWKALIQAELGQEEADYFQAVMDGKIIEPLEEWFDGAFTISKGTVTDPVRGTIRKDAYIWTKKADVDWADI